MSGPWDRPPSSNPDDDRDWPAEDLEPRSSADRPVEPWSADDPWQERRDPSPDWDEWPPQAPPADEYELDEPGPPASDPWAESWDADVPGIPTSPHELDREPDRLTDAVAEPPAPSAFEPPAAEPEPMPAPEAHAELDPPPELQPFADAEANDAPRIEPWSPDPDPWGAAWTVSAATEEPIAEPEPEPEPEPVVDANGDRPSTDDQPVLGSWDSDIEHVSDVSGVPPIWEAQAVPPPAGDVGASDQAAADASWEPDLWAEPEAEAEVDAVAQREVAAEAEAEPNIVAAAAAASLAEPSAAGAPATDPDTLTADEPEQEPAEGTEASERPSGEAATAAALAASRLAVESPPESPWPERVDPTEVLPTTWAPPPPAPHEGDGIEPSGGEVRTSLGRSEPEVDDELAEEPTTAEQAVPWLIGVILLLAGMVIVLLALIFAGDASLGGASDDATPSPTSAVALLPSGTGERSAAPSPTVRPTPSPSASPSAEPSASVAAMPEYGALEMVYQGRSAALEPIYLLRHDFTVEAEPEVLAQDPSLDVQRFAWSPDGTRGAFLYADLLVGIDPGVDVHQLSDGISAIAFGDDPSTVYAVRVRRDGDNNIASILAVKQAGGDEQQLARVSYPRPEDGGRSGLAEAQFLDDGGAVRLYWMHDDALLLWVEDSGAWTIDPAKGRAAPAESEEVPVLWAPEGERRIALETKGSETRMHLVDRSGDALVTASVEGRVSHLRWSPRGDQVVFTLGRSAAGGGVLQDLYLWDLGEGEDPAPKQITNTGAAFGAEWLGSQSRWEES